MKGQAAIEYILTYWWVAVLIMIGIVVLFIYGPANYASLSPRAQPGSCQVYRPYGPSSTTLETLQGLCGGEMPQYVISFNGKGGAWTFSCVTNGTCINFTPPFPNQGICNATIVIWSYDTGMGSAGAITDTFGSWTDGSTAVPNVGALGGVVGMFNKTNTEGSLDIEYNDTVIRYEARNQISRDQILLHEDFYQKWVQTAITLNNGVAVGYMNGVAVTPNSPNIGCIRLLTGSIGIWDRNFNGYITNLQIYNTSLSASSIQQLYIEGAGGAPIALKNLAGWWPLNGNTNDYSGNRKNGLSQDISFTGQYATTYPTT